MRQRLHQDELRKFDTYRTELYSEFIAEEWPEKDVTEIAASLAARDKIRNKEVAITANEYKSKALDQLSKIPQEGGENVGVGKFSADLRDAIVLNSNTALCLSGGGIRSSTFCLGVIQSLADREILNKFHYLSTVSGGGYIGCWLSAWMLRAKKAFTVGNDAAVDSDIFDTIGAGEVQRLLSSPSASLPEPAAVTHLRSYSNYMSPSVGVFTTCLLYTSDAADDLVGGGWRGGRGG